MKADHEQTPCELKKRIRQILTEQNIRQTEFAKSLGISANYVYLLASGKKKNISEPLARLIESTYGYCAKWILTGQGQKLSTAQSKETLKSETIRKVRNLPPQELRAVAAFLKSLEEMND